MVLCNTTDYKLSTIILLKYFIKIVLNKFFVIAIIYIIYLFIYMMS